MTPPLLSGKGDQLMVLGFYSLARRALLEPLMRFGVPVVGGLGGLNTLFLEVGRTCGHKHALPRGWTGSPCICAHLRASRSVVELACFFDRNAGLACDVFMTSLLAGLAGRPPGPSDPVLQPHGQRPVSSRGGPRPLRAWSACRSPHPQRSGTCHPGGDQQVCCGGCLICMRVLLYFSLVGDGNSRIAHHQLVIYLYTVTRSAAYVQYGVHP